MKRKCNYNKNCTRQPQQAMHETRGNTTFDSSNVHPPPPAHLPPLLFHRIELFLVLHEHSLKLLLLEFDVLEVLVDLALELLHGEEGRGEVGDLQEKNFPGGQRAPRM